MGTTSTKSVTIPIEDLELFHAGLAQSFFRAESSSDLFAKENEFIKFRCDACDITVNWQEVERVALAEDSLALSEPKLKRLKVGCCAREGCDAGTYLVLLPTASDLDWGRIAADAIAVMQQQKLIVAKQRQQKVTLRRRKSIIRNLRALVILLLFFVGAFWWKNGRLPFVKKTPKYRVAPESVDPRFSPAK